MDWLKKIWNKGYRLAEDGYKFGSRSRVERRAIKADTASDAREQYLCVCTCSGLPNPAHMCGCDYGCCEQCSRCKCTC